MYESFFKTIELSMQPAIGMAEINRLAMERIANQQTECMSDCIKAGMEQWFAYADLDDPQSLADLQFKYLKLYEQQLSITAESNVQTLSQASDALQKIMGASMDQLVDSNPFMTLMTDLGVSSSADPFFDWFKQSVKASQSVADRAASAAMPDAAQPAVAASGSTATAKTASRASAPAKSPATRTTNDRSASRKTQTNASAKGTSAKSSSAKSSSVKSSSGKSSSVKSTPAKSASSNSTSPKSASTQTDSEKTSSVGNSASAKSGTEDSKNS